MPYSYGDEMIYLTLGEGIRQGVTLYSQIYDNKPPFLYLTAAIAGSLFWFKVILCLWNLVSIFAFWKLAERLFPKKDTLQKVSTLVFALLTTLPMLEGNIANAELFMVLPTILAFYLLLSEKKTYITYFSSGVLFSLASLFKMPAMFELPVMFFFFVISEKLSVKNVIKNIKYYLFVVAGFLLPLLLTFAYFALMGALPDYIKAAFLENFGYLSSWRPDDQKLSFLVKNGPLLVRSLIVLFGTTLLYLFRKKLHKNFLLVTLWLLFSLFAVTLSERPYPHYLIQAVPAFSFLIGILITDKTMMQSFSVIPLALALFVPVYYKYWYYPTAPYYQNFINLTIGRLSKTEYLKKYGGEVPRNYRIAQTVKGITSPKERIFVWGDDSKIYALSKRLPLIKYVADYHLTPRMTNSQIVDILKTNGVRVIVVLDENNLPSELRGLIEADYLKVLDIESASVYKLPEASLKNLITIN